MDKISNDCCLLIDGSTAVYHLHPDQDMKETSFKSIVSINNFFEELNSNKKFYNKILGLYFSDFVTSGVLINTEYQSLLDENLNELKNSHRAISNAQGGANGKERDFTQHSANATSHAELIENLCNEIISASDCQYVFRISESEINELKTKTLKTLLKVLLDQHLQNQKLRKEENIYVVNGKETGEKDSDTGESDAKKAYHNLILSFDILNSIIKKSDSQILRDRAFATISDQNSHTNYKKIQEILKARLAYAKSLGYSSFAEYRMHLNGVQIHPSKMIDYLLNLWIDLRANMILEYSSLYLGTQKDENNKSHVNNKYLLNYEVESLRASLIDLNLKYIDEKIISKKFITIGNVLNGLQMLTKALFGLELNAVLDEEHVKEDLMHESILITTLNLTQSNNNSTSEALNCMHPNNPSNAELDSEMRDNKGNNKSSKEKVAKIYFDFFKREGKFVDVFSQFTIRGSKNLNLMYQNKGEIRQTPIVILATNFEVTDLDLLNMPISFTDAKNIMHEFGHVLHSCLSKTDFQSISGSRVPLDFAEIPSHFLEYFIYDFAFCKNFMIDNKTNIPIDEKLHSLLASQSQMFSNLDLQETLHYSLFDLIIHSFTEEKYFEDGNLEKIYNTLIKNFYISSLQAFDEKHMSQFDQLLSRYSNSINYKFPIDRFYSVLTENSGSLKFKTNSSLKTQQNSAGLSEKSEYLEILLDDYKASHKDNNSKARLNQLKRINEVYAKQINAEDQNNKNNNNKNYSKHLHNFEFNIELNKFLEQNFLEENFEKSRLQREKLYDKNLYFTTIPHIKAYPSAYYSYIIGKIFANLIWTEGFYKANVNVSQSGNLLAEEYLSKGNTESSLKCIKNFLEKINDNKKYKIDI